jgi:hypothetical protein
MQAEDDLVANDESLAAIPADRCSGTTVNVKLPTADTPRSKASSAASIAV